MQQMDSEEYAIFLNSRPDDLVEIPTEVAEC